jgi:hypothetical protein
MIQDIRVFIYAGDRYNYTIGENKKYYLFDYVKPMVYLP